MVNLHDYNPKEQAPLYLLMYISLDKTTCWMKCYIFVTLMLIDVKMYTGLPSTHRQNSFSLHFMWYILSTSPATLSVTMNHKDVWWSVLFNMPETNKYIKKKYIYIPVACREHYSWAFNSAIITEKINHCGEKSNSTILLKCLTTAII